MQNSAQIVEQKLNNMKEKEIKSVHSKCASCGANLIFCPSKQDLVCEKCESHYPIKNEGTIETHDLDNNQEIAKLNQTFKNENKIFKCKNCGARIVLNTYEISKQCPYCGAGLVMDKSVMDGIIPDACIPFAFDEKEASDLFVKAVSKRHFVPKKFKRNIPENQIHGIYIPAFAFDASTMSAYDGRLYNEYETTDSDGHSHTERSYFHISGSQKEEFEDVIVECSSKITQEEIEGVLPYQFHKKKPYNNAYILGYSVEHYSETLNESIPDYKSEIEATVRRHILNKYHYDGISYLNVNTKYSNEKYRYYLLPMYRFEYQYKKKDFVTYMNGQTGAVDSNLPKSGWAIALAILIPFIIVLIPIIIGIISSIK